MGIDKRQGEFLGCGPAVEAIASPKTMRRPTKRHGWRETKSLIRGDMAFRCTYEHKSLTWPTALRLLGNAGVASTIRYRLQCFLMSNGLRPLGAVLKWYNLALYGVSIDERARIGAGLLIAHAVSIVIGEDVEIGERCILFHQNLISRSPFAEPGVENGPVVIGNDVSFGGGACAFGRIVIGNGCRIGPNAVAERSFPPNTVVFGVPGRGIAKVAQDERDTA